MRVFLARSRCCRCSTRPRSGGSAPVSRALGSTRLMTRDTVAAAGDALRPPAAAVPFHVAAVELPLAALVAEAEVTLTAAAAAPGCE